MKKLRLELDEISVESFHVQNGDGEPGTIHGNQEAETGDAVAITGWSWLCGSCDATCGAGATCPISCGGQYPTACNSPYCRDKLISEIERCVDQPIDTGVDIG
jgi:hypothetical protein